MTYRDDSATLRAECERLRAEVAGLRAAALREAATLADEYDAAAVAARLRGRALDAEEAVAALGAKGRA